MHTSARTIGATCLRRLRFAMLAIAALGAPLAACAAASTAGAAASAGSVAPAAPAASTVPAAVTAAAGSPAAPAAATAAEQEHALFDADWQWRLQHQPEFATAVGEHRYDALLSDTSPEAARAAIEHARAMLEAIRAIDPEQLGNQDHISYDLFAGEQESKLAAAAFVPFDPQPITAQGGIQLLLPQLLAEMPFATEQDYRNYIGRINSLPHYVDGVIAQLREGMRSGWTAPKVLMEPVPEQLRQMRLHLADGPVGAPLRRIPATIEPDVRRQLAEQGRLALESGAAPALQRLEEFIRSTYLPAARESIAASSLPGGAAWYALQVRNATTTSLTPDQIHALGMKEVARIRTLMKDAIARTGFAGDFAQFAAFARSDPRLFYSDADALLARYRRTIARATARLPAVVGTIPAEDLAVRQATQPGGIAAWYQAGTPEAPAALVVNTARLSTLPMWEIETLALHEAVPGHHLQVARAHELDLPPFRRFGWYVAFGEGWATYAETLGPEMGFYQDAFSAFGQLEDQLLRAARLVVDTGIHALRWSRRNAIDYLDANTANAHLDNEVEVDRYIAQPGQALGYTVGQLRIQALRDKAKAALGDRFDLRRFHDAVLGSGALPLPLLEREIDRWIASEAERTKTLETVP